MPNMEEAVRPLFACVAEKQWAFAGTGFFIDHGNQQLLVTADHVVAGRPISVFVLPDDPTRGFTIDDALKPTSLVVSDRKNDLAVLEVQGFQSSTPLALSNSMIPTNVRIGTLEYARFSLDPSAGIVHQNHTTRAFFYHSRSYPAAAK